MHFESPENARCSEHKLTKQNIKCTFIMPDGSVCPNFHHTQSLICSFHGTKNRIDYLKRAPGWIVKPLEEVGVVPVPKLVREFKDNDDHELSS